MGGLCLLFALEEANYVCHNRLEFFEIVATANIMFSLCHLGLLSGFPMTSMNWPVVAYDMNFLLS